MAKPNDCLGELKQVTEFMEKHDLLKVKMRGIHIERGRPEDASDLMQKKQLDAKEREEAKRIAKIRLNCPYPCPHWQTEREGAKDESLARAAIDGDSVSNERHVKSASTGKKRGATRK